MNKLSRALGRWLFHPYRCNICHQKMNIHDGLVTSNKDDTIVVHKECRNKYATR
jgi:hypothetical protein